MSPIDEAKNESPVFLSKLEHFLAWTILVLNFLKVCLTYSFRLFTSWSSEREEITLERSLGDICHLPTVSQSDCASVWLLREVRKRYCDSNQSRNLERKSEPTQFIEADHTTVSSVSWYLIFSMTQKLLIAGRLCVLSAVFGSIGSWESRTISKSRWLSREVSSKGMNLDGLPKFARMFNQIKG